MSNLINIFIEEILKDIKENKDFELYTKFREMHIFSLLNPEE